jgi:hypothetical protein
MNNTHITAYILTGEQLEQDISANDYVEYEDDTYGLILEKHESNFEFPGGSDPDSDVVEVEASGDDPVYIVGKGEGGTEPMSGDGLTVVDRDEIFDEDDPDGSTDIEDVDEEELVEMSAYGSDYESPDVEELVNVDAIPGVSGTNTGDAPWPPSWYASSKPARLIALDAWQDFNLSFTGCAREMRGRVRRVNAFCAAFKDAILGYESWREGG